MTFFLKKKKKKYARRAHRALGWRPYIWAHGAVRLETLVDEITPGGRHGGRSRMSADELPPPDRYHALDRIRRRRTGCNQGRHRSPG